MAANRNFTGIWSSPQVDANNNPILTSRTEQYGYDELSRLTAVDYGDGGTQSYSFDNMGNRLQKQDSATGTENYTYNNANMLLTKGANTYTIDADGNTLTGGGRTNTWDSENRLTQCVFNNQTSSFVYGSDGLRHRSALTTAAGMTTTTDYALDGQSVVQELRTLSGVQTPIATYLTGPSGPMYKRQDGQGIIRWYVYDGLGSVVGEVDPNGVMTARRGFDVYGATRSSSGTPSSKHGFVGGLGHPSEDETGLVYMRARYYDAGVGRFVSEDPERSGTNWFVYCDENPTSAFDTDGKKFTPVSGLAIGLGMFFTMSSWGAIQAKETNQALWLSGAAVVSFAFASIGNVSDLSPQYAIYFTGLLMTKMLSEGAINPETITECEAAQSVPYARTAVLLCFTYNLEIAGAMVADDIEQGV